MIPIKNLVNTEINKQETNVFCNLSKTRHNDKINIKVLSDCRKSIVVKSM